MTGTVFDKDLRMLDDTIYLEMSERQVRERLEWAARHIAKLPGPQFVHHISTPSAPGSSFYDRLSPTKEERAFAKALRFGERYGCRAGLNPDSWPDLWPARYTDIIGGVTTARRLVDIPLTVEQPMKENNLTKRVETKTETTTKTTVSITLTAAEANTLRRFLGCTVNYEVSQLAASGTDAAPDFLYKFATELPGGYDHAVSTKVQAAVSGIVTIPAQPEDRWTLVRFARNNYLGTRLDCREFYTAYRTRQEWRDKANAETKAQRLNARLDRQEQQWRVVKLPPR